MRKSTAISAAFAAESQVGESLHFELCKGGYFSNRDEYGLRIVGKTEQKTLTGKNLLKTNSNAWNIACGVDIKTSSDGIVKVKGTATSGGGRLSFGNVFPSIALSPGTYILSLTNTLKSSAILSNAVSNEYFDEISPGRNYRLFTLTQATQLVLGLNFANGTAYDEEFQCQLELGKVATAYEPYCGGIPSPNPDYPQPIRCVKAGTAVRVYGGDLAGRLGQVLLPCDLYEGDVWYPTSGKVERWNAFLDLTLVSKWWYYETTTVHQYYDSGALPYKAHGTRIVHSDKLRGIHVNDRDNNFHTIYIVSSGLGIAVNLPQLMESIDAFKTWINEVNPTVIYRLAEPLLEQYDPQPVFAPRGTVNVIQDPIELTAELGATVLTRR